METRRYKGTGERVSLLGFGSMRLPVVDKTSQEIDMGRARAMVDHAMSHGINFYSTTHPHYRGTCGEVVTQALAKYPRDRYMLAATMPRELPEAGAYAEKVFEQQLRSNRAEFFDYYLLPDMDRGIFEKVQQHRVYELLKKKRREGKIRRIGFSFRDRPPVLEKVLNTYDWDFAQIQLNCVDWGFQDVRRQYKILEARRIPVIATEPLRGGSLGNLNGSALAVLRQENPEVSAASWALRFPASLDGVLTVLCSMSSMSHLTDNLRTFSTFAKLTAKEQAALDRAVEAFRREGRIPCTACYSCTDCPKGIDIPKLFNIYNRYGESGERDFFSTAYRAVGEARQAHQCYGCGECAGICPQGIDISLWLEKIAVFAQDNWDKVH